MVAKEMYQPVVNRINSCLRIFKFKHRDAILKDNEQCDQ